MVKYKRIAYGKPKKLKAFNGVSDVAVKVVQITNFRPPGWGYRLGRGK